MGERADVGVYEKEWVLKNNNKKIIKKLFNYNRFVK